MTRLLCCVVFHGDGSGRPPGRPRLPRRISRARTAGKVKSVLPTPPVLRGSGAGGEGGVALQPKTPSPPTPLPRSTGREGRAEPHSAEVSGEWRAGVYR